VARRALTGVVLVGGASTRFGSPKALATIDGETFVDRARRTLAEACDEVLVVGKPGELPFDVVDDGTDVRAPIAGVVAGLRAMRTEVAVVIPVDMPLLTPDALGLLAEACRDAAIAQRGPLPCAVARRALPAFETGERRLRTVLDGLDTARVELEDALLANVNTPADLDTLAR